MNIHHFDRIQEHYLVFSLPLFPIIGCGTAKMLFSSLNIRAVTLESLHSLAVFHKDQDSGVKVKICIFYLLFGTFSFSFINSTSLSKSFAF